MNEIVYHTNFKVEDEYWWFTARNRIIKSLINRFCNNPENNIQTDNIEKLNLLDVGCGTGGFAKFISTDFNIHCLDTSEIALEYCSKRDLKNLYCMTLDKFPYLELENNNIKIQRITMLDVIEHIKDNTGVVKSAHDILEKNGYLIASVPAYMWLWSSHDELHQHIKRYTKSEFNELLENAGFKIIYTSYFNFFLFLPAVIIRFLGKLKSSNKNNQSPVDEVPEFLNKIFDKLFGIEANLLKYIRFPFGLSIISIAKKI